VYGTCFAVLVLLAALTHAPVVPQPGRELAIFAALALGPMLLGHTGLNWALKHSPAYVVNLTLLGEPVGATLIAALLPGIREIPSPATLAGGAVVLAGILLTARE
jgi:drug/metabolite transporter (DMT)-like permease